MTLPTVITSQQVFFNTDTTNLGSTWSISVNANTALLIVYVLNDLGRSVTTCNFAGTAMTLGGTFAKSDMRTSVYYRTNPATGSQNLEVGMNYGCRLAVVAIQVNGYSMVQSATGGGDSNNLITINVTTTLPDTLIFSGACCNTQNITAYNGTALQSGTGTLRYSVGCVTAETAGSQTVSYTLASQPTYGATAEVLPVVGVFGRQFGVAGSLGL